MWELFGSVNDYITFPNVVKDWLILIASTNRAPVA